jgi:hypothetical protein
MDPFLGPWKIDNWEKGNLVAHGIPENGFKKGGPLNITQITSNTVELWWENDEGDDCTASGLIYEEENSQLGGINIPVTFPGLVVPCDLQVALNPDKSDELILKIVRIEGLGEPAEVGSGVVTATANPGGVPQES